MKTRGKSRASILKDDHKEAAALPKLKAAKALPSMLPVGEVDLLQLKLCAAEEQNIALQVGPLNQRLQEVMRRRQQAVYRIAQHSGMAPDTVAQRYRLDVEAGRLVLMPEGQPAPPAEAEAAAS